MHLHFHRLRTNSYLTTYKIVHKANLYGITHNIVRSYGQNRVRNAYAQMDCAKMMHRKKVHKHLVCLPILQKSQLR